MEECTIKLLPPPDGGGDGPDLPDGVQFTTLSVMNDCYWGPETRVIPVSFLDVGDRPTIDMVLSHMNAWDCGITFAWSQGGGWVRITTGAGGYWSYLGKQILQLPAGQPTMNLEAIGLWTPESERRRVIRHETWHTLGGGHEHLREEFVRDINPILARAYYWETQRWPAAVVDANVLRPLSSASIMGTPPDGHSIAAYPIPGWITFSGNGIPGGLDINETDRAFARKIYPKLDVPAPPVSPDPTPPPAPPGPDPEVETLTPGAWSADRAYVPPREVQFRFLVKRRGEFVLEAAGDGPFLMGLSVGPAAKGDVLGLDNRSTRTRSRLVARLRAGAYILRVRRREEVAGVVRARVASTS